MPRIISSYKAILMKMEINTEFEGNMPKVQTEEKGVLTVYESEKLHPGERFVRFISKEKGTYLSTACGEISVKGSSLVIVTHNTMNKYCFKLLERIQTIDFRMYMPERYLHICSGCGKREILSSLDAFKQGWDFPGPDGIYKDMPNQGFGIMTPRTCGSCGIEKSLYWKKVTGTGSNYMTPQEEREELERISNEPWSLITEGEKNNG